jgi:V/A-type H+-transporting ATPase subunit I
MEDVIPALWLHPLNEPILVLSTSLAFGVFVVTLGLGLDAHQCHWRGEDMEFWGVRLGLPMTYFGFLYSIVFLDSLGLWLVLLGTVWFIAGSAIRARRDSLPAADAAAAEYIETVLQLLVNTISFVRVGAFALAHAGLSAAMIGMTEGAESFIAILLIMLVGNALIIALEGLVVSIQTTRLVLFEFFIRFLRSSARSFKPLPDPGANKIPETRREP